MELLSQASRILYDKEMLDYKKRLHEAEEENKILHTPQVRYSSKEEWEARVKIFKDTINSFVFNHQSEISVGWRVVCGLHTTFFIHFRKIYEDSLFTLLKYKHKEWCKYITNDIIESIQIGFAGLESIVTKGGNGTYPFTNWCDNDFKMYIWNIIHYHQGWNFKSPSSRKTSWLYDIPLIDSVVKQ